MGWCRGLRGVPEGGFRWSVEFYLTGRVELDTQLPLPSGCGFLLILNGILVGNM